MRITTLRITVAFVALLLGASRAGAAPIIFQQAFAGPYDGSEWCAPCGAGGFAVFDEFVVSGASTIGSIDFHVSHASFPPSLYLPENIQISFANEDDYANPFNVQTFAAGSYTVAAVTANSSLVTIDLTDFLLAAGTYEIGFFNTGGDDIMVVPGWLGGNTDSVSWHPALGASGHDGQGSQFTIYGADVELDPEPVPEPSTMLLLGGGLLAAGYRLRRKQ